MGTALFRQLSQTLKAKGYDVKSQAAKVAYVYGITKKVISDILDGDKA